MSTEQDTTTDEPRGLTRRTLLRRTAVAGAGVALIGSVDTIFGAGGASAATASPLAQGYGPLVPDPAGRLSLPAGFRYVVVAEAGVTRLDSGEPSPSDCDGMAEFDRRPGTGSVLVCNHEISGSEPYQVPLRAGYVYDAEAGGGTTTISVDKDGRRLGQRVSLAGTENNCAGGKTPWDTWLTCEETERIRAKRHGYVFEVDPYDDAANRDPQPILALGRYAHEAVVVDPRTDQLYLTEDASNPNGLLYRWTPPRGVKLGKGALRRLGPTDGALEALTVTDAAGRHVTDLSLATEIGTVYRTGWTTVPDRDATTTSTRKQLTAEQVTRSRKLEGMWWGDGGAYFVSSFARTSDGSAVQHDGQVWFLDPRGATVTLVLRFATSPDQDVDPDGPDNITVSPFGGVMIAEDGDGTNHLLGATASGNVFFFARNEIEGDSEFCGPVFSENRRTLFANCQGPGLTYAITGPFARQR